MSTYLQLALDPSAHVRECSCFCLGQFAEHCQPEILDHSEEVLPIVFRLLDDATDNVKVRAGFLVWGSLFVLFGFHFVLSSFYRLDCRSAFVCGCIEMPIKYLCFRQKHLEIEMCKPRCVSVYTRH